MWIDSKCQERWKSERKALKFWVLIYEHKNESFKKYLNNLTATEDTNYYLWPWAKHPGKECAVFAEHLLNTF